MDWKSLPPGDPALIDKIVQEYMSQGKFDELRRKMLAEVDTLSSYHNVKQRMENSVRSYLDRQRWRPDLPKNQLRDGLKRHVAGAPFLRPGVRRTISLLVNKDTMDDHRSDLEAIARNLLGICEKKIEPEVMDIQPDSMDSPDDNRMVIATDEDTMNASENNDDEKLIVALEDLSIPEIKEESQSSEKPEGPILEQDMSDEESDHSIIKQMSPISVGTPSPPSSPVPVPDTQSTIKRAFEFVGKIPKVKKEEEVKVKEEEEVKVKVKEEEEVKVKVKEEDEGKSKPREEKRDRSREKKSSRDRDRRSYKSSRRDRDSDHRSRDRDRRRDSERRDKRDRNESRDKDRSKRDERHKRDDRSSDGKSRKDDKSSKESKVVDKPVDVVLEKVIKLEPVADPVMSNSADDQTVLEKVKEEGKDETPGENKTDPSLVSPMTTRSRLRPPVPENLTPSGTENVYSKKYLRPARRDIR